MLINKYIALEMDKLNIEETKKDDYDMIDRIKEKLALDAMKKYDIR